MFSLAAVERVAPRCGGALALLRGPPPGWRQRLHLQDVKTTARHVCKLQNQKRGLSMCMCMSMSMMSMSMSMSMCAVTCERRVRVRGVRGPTSV